VWSQPGAFEPRIQLSGLRKEGKRRSAIRSAYDGGQRRGCVDNRWPSGAKLFAPFSSGSRFSILVASQSAILLTRRGQHPYAPAYGPPGPTNCREGARRAKNAALPEFGSCPYVCAHRCHLRFTSVGGVRRCRGSNGVCAGRSPRRWSVRPDVRAVLPRVLFRPLVLRRWLGYRCERRTARRYRRYRRYRRSTSLSFASMSRHRFNKGVSNVHP
jgi:hypothetical protein